MYRTLRVAAVSALAATALILLNAGPAVASGGISISTAPVAPINTPVYGNLATDALSNEAVGDFPCGEEFWLIPVVVGDTVEITFEESSGSDFAALYAPGTTDSTVFSAQAIDYGFSLSGDNDGFTANETAEYVLAVGSRFPPCSSGVGPFEFEVSATHNATVSVPSRITGAPHHISTVNAIFRYDDGSPVTDSGLKVTLYGRWSQPSYAPKTWHRLAATTPSNGTAPLRFTPPAKLAGQTIMLRVSAVGDFFKPIHSSEIRFRIEG